MSLETIVVGVDGSDGARQALEFAAEIAAPTGASIVAVHAFRPLDHLADMPQPIDFEALESEARRRLRDVWCEPLRMRGVAYDTEILHGEEADVIHDVATRRRADLIVVGARGLNAIQRLLVGSTSMKLVQMSRIPVTVVHHPD